MDGNSPAHIFGVVFYIIWKFSNLILGDALQPINHQLEHSEQVVKNKHKHSEQVVNNKHKHSEQVVNNKQWPGVNNKNNFAQLSPAIRQRCWLSRPS